MCGTGSSRITETARATSTAEIGEVLLLPSGNARSYVATATKAGDGNAKRVGATG
jgi:hypothetical protein